MKQSFPIPENCTTVTVEQVENKIVCTFEEKFVPKDGDFCMNNRGTMYIYRSGGYSPYHERYYFMMKDDKMISYTPSSGVCTPTRLLTESEKQTLLDALAKDGKKWNAELKRIEKLRWTPKEGTLYFYAYTYYGKAFVCDGVSCDDMVTRERVKSGNCYQMQSEAQAVADRINTIFAEQL